MSNIFYFLIILLCLLLVAAAYYAGYVYGKVSESKPIDKKYYSKKRKPPDSEGEKQFKEYKLQLYNIEHYNGSADGMRKKGGV